MMILGSGVLKHVQTFRLIKNKNESIVLAMEGKKRSRKTDNIQQISSVS